LESTSDLSDYTIVGVTPAAAVTEEAPRSQVAPLEDLTDYTLTGALLSVAASTASENRAEAEGARELDAPLTGDITDGTALGLNGIAKGSAQS